MQDPFLNLTHENPIDLNTLFGPAAGIGSMNGGEAEDGTLGESTTESGTIEQEDADEIEMVMEENKEEEEEEVEKGSLEERIKKIEEEYNETPIPIYGSVQKRLVTLAKNLQKKKLLQQASTVCNILDGE